MEVPSTSKPIHNPIAVIHPHTPHPLPPLLAYMQVNSSLSLKEEK